jgi:hypothetical protein
MNAQLTPGANVSIVFYVDGLPVAISGELASADPFEVWTKTEAAAKLALGRRAMVVVQSGKEFHKAEAELHAEQQDGGWRVWAKSFGWESVDRRRYPRYEMQLPVTLRAVLESDNGIELTQIEGVTEDVSIGGLWVKAPRTLAGSSLAEVSVELSPNSWIRALSLVKWADSSDNGLGFGVEFLDFLDGSRYALHQFLTQKAA